MTREGAVTLLMSRLGNRTGLEAKIRSEILLAQTKLEGMPVLPWFLVVDTGSVNTVASTRSAALPTDFLRMWEETFLYLTASSGTRTRIPLEDYGFVTDQDNYVNEATPEMAAVVGLSLHFSPKPDAIYNVAFAYYAKAAVLSTDISNAWLDYAPDLLIAETGIQVARFLRDALAVQMFRDEKAEAMARLAQENTARREAGMIREMGG